MSGSVNTSGQTSNQVTNQNQTGNQAQNSTSTLTPYGAAGLGGILSNLSNINPNLSPTSTSAIAELTNQGAAGSPFTSDINTLTSGLISGNNPYAKTINDAYNQYRTSLAPITNPANLDPRNTPGFGAALSATNADITNQINSATAGSGRSGSGYATQNLARGLSQGEGGLLAGQYNQNVSNLINAGSQMFGAGATTANTGANLTQMGVQNVPTANTQSQYGPLLELQAQSMTTGIPLSILAAQYGIAGPAASTFGTTTGSATGTNTGTMQGTANTTTQNTSPLWQQLAGGVLGGASLLGGNQGLLKALGYTG